MAQENKVMQKAGFKQTMKDSHIWGILLFFVLLLIDQLTKFWADAYFSAPDAPETIKIIPGWIELCQHYNKGIAFSGLHNAPAWVKILLIIGTGALMAVFSVFYFKMDKRRTFLRWSIVFVVAGGVGNLIDRLYFKMWLPDAPFGVRDMVTVNFQIFDFGVCNFADFFISAGAVMLVIAIAFLDKDAFVPLGKYKALAEEAEKEREAKEKAKKSQKHEGENVIAGAPKQEGGHAARELVWRETEEAEPAEKAEETQPQEIKEDSANNG